MTELLPCPFCGVTSALLVAESFGDSEVRFVVCNACGAEGPTAWTCSDREVVRRWNERVSMRRATPEEEREEQAEEPRDKEHGGTMSTKSWPDLLDAAGNPVPVDTCICGRPKIASKNTCCATCCLGKHMTGCSMRCATLGVPGFGVTAVPLPKNDQYRHRSV